MNKLEKALYSVKEFLILSKCPCCGEVTKYSGTLCPVCREKYENEKSFACPFCGMSADKCFCSTEKLTVSKDFGTGFSSMLFYSKDLPTVTNLVFALKRKADKNCEKFFAEEFSAFILDYFERKGIDRDSYILTYPPRTKQSERLYGFDHMKRLCRKVSRKTGMKYETVFSHTGAEIQKKLSQNEREINAGISLNMLPSAHVKRKKYIIIDDVITSGATLNRCEKLLKRHGAASYFAITLSRTVSTPKITRL